MPNVPNNIVVVGGIRSGFSRNDGSVAGYGTPHLTGQIKVNTTFGETTNIDNIPTEEQDDSPTIEFAEQCTVTHHYKGSYNNCLTYAIIYQRGALVADDFGNYYRVLSSTPQYQKGGRAILTIVSESISFDVPPDEFSLNPTKLGLDLLKHPRYFYALMPTNQIPNFTGTADTNAQIAAKQAIIRAIQAYRENPFIPTTANLNGLVGGLHDSITTAAVSGKLTMAYANPAFNPANPATGPDPIGSSSPSANPAYIYTSFDKNSSDPNGKVALALAAMQEIIGKLWRMEDTPLMNGLELTNTEYWFRPPPINLGGYIEDPRSASPAVADYFISTAYPPNGVNTIFDSLSYFNPQCYSTTGIYGGPVSISWLRDADVLEYSRTWFRVTRKWLGAPIGAWDSDIYGAVLSGGNRPSIPAHYRNLILS